jgi:outer membrane receptor protein involved in Fe transport
VLEVPFIEGLSLSVDYYDAKYVNLAGNLNLATRLILFPDTILRLPRPASDPPEWLGPVLGYTEQPVNIALSRTSGYDFGLRYRWPTRWGEWSAQANASKTKRREFRTAPTQPLLVFPPSPIQLVGSVFLKRGALGLGVTGSYKDALEESFDVEPIAPSAIRWDMQVSYDFAESAWAGAHGRSWWGSALGNTRMNLTIFNAFDVMPPLYANSFRQPDNSVVDSRMRRYSLSLTRSF